MNKRHLLATFLFFLGLGLNAQTVYSVKYESQADVKVFVVAYESQADLLVYKEDIHLVLRGMKGIGFLWNTNHKQIRVSTLLNTNHKPT